MVASTGAKVTQKVTNKILSGKQLTVNFNTDLVLSKAGKTKIYLIVDAADDDLSDDTITFTTDVLPAPGGANFSTPTALATNAIYQYGKPNDITVLGQPVEYDVVAPTKYSNAGYGASSDWQAFVQARTQGGRNIPGMSITAPSGGNNMKVKFVTNDATLEDTMITMELRVLDNINGCDTFIKRNVFIYPSITPDFTFPQPVCVGDAVLFENKSKILSGSMEFEWDFGTGNASDITEAPEPVFQFPGSGTYDVTLTTKTNPNGFVFKKTQKVVVSPIPTIAFNKLNACEGDQLSFTNKTTTPTGAGTPSYTWSFGDNSANKNTKDATHKYAKPGSYNVTLKADLNGCIATMTQKVYQFTKPTAGYTKVEGSCDNDEFSFNNETKVASGLFGSYWNFDDNGAISTDANATHDFNTSGDKRVKLVVTSEFGCKDSITKTIQVKESPKASYINGPLCSVKPTDFTNTTPNVANAIPQYTWDFGDGTTSGAKSPTKDWKGNLGPKKVTLTVTLDNGCTQTVIKDLVVLTQPTPNFAAEDVCAGDDVIFVNNTTWAQGEIKYKWDFGDGTTSANSDPTKKYNTSVTLTPFVTLYAYINGGCGDSITKNITINETPRTCDFVAEPDYSYGFYGMKFDPINNSGVVGGQDEVNYVWVFEGGGSQPTSGKNATAFNNFATDGEYKITMRATMQQTGCECSISKKVVMNRSSVEDLQNGGVAVYPNPASGVFTVATNAVFGKGSVIEVMNMNGAVVKRMDSMGGMTQVEASELSSGMYLVKVSNGTQSVTRKVNIQN
jgi:PKD repeat protein